MNDAKTVMRKMVDMFATGDVDAVESVVATDYVDHQDDVGICGLDGFRNLVRTIHAPGEGAVHVRIDDLISEGDRAAARLRWHHANVDGSVVERETIDIIRCANGQAVEHWGAEVSRR